MRAKIIKPPTIYSAVERTTIFLAGSIEMGSAYPWQDEFAKKFNWNYLFYNPRRDDWDSSWKQDPNEPKFYEQVAWEMKYIEASDIVVFNFVPDTKSPITLLELGLVLGTREHKAKRSVFVCCPDGFWRKGNVEMVCRKYGVQIFNNLDSVKQAIISR